MVDPSSRERRMRGQLVLVGGPRGRERRATPPPGSGVTVDLQEAIDNLRLLRSDLEAYLWEQTADTVAAGDDRYQIAFWARQVTDRTAGLEMILMHKGSPRLVLAGADAADEAALRGASQVLDQWIREDEPFREVARKVAAILQAADRIGLTAAGGRPSRPESVLAGRW